jgi:hypothetical protein
MKKTRSKKSRVTVPLRFQSRRLANSFKLDDLKMTLDDRSLFKGRL